MKKIISKVGARYEKKQEQKKETPKIKTENKESENE